MNRLTKRLLATTAVMTLAWSSAALADGVALVLGNGTYDRAPTAQTAVRDAKAVAAALEEAGWTVSMGTDLDRDAMRGMLRTFAGAAAEADEVAIFYSGHALRTGGVTYLAPTDAQAASLTDVLFDGVPLDLVMRIAGEKAGNAVIFLDGAQLRGFRPTEFVEPGLAALEGPEGVLIISAAEPGRAVRRSRWRDSRFARLIIDQFLQPGASVQEVAEDAASPTFVIGAADPDFMLSPEPEGVSEPDSLEAEIELAYWRTAERSGKAEDYQAYLKRYPKGTFSEFARERLGMSAEAETVPEEPKIDPRILAERDLNLSRIRKRKIQEYLMALGFDPRGIDGLFGPGSRRAITGWQKKNGYDNEGWLTAEMVTKLTTQGEAALAEQRRIAEEQRRIREAEDNAYWSATGARATADGYRDYLKKYPEGLNAKLARAALAKIAEAEADAAARRELAAFERAQSADSAEAYRNYLGTYPEGIYRDEALARLDAIEGAERAAAQTAKWQAREDGLQLTLEDRSAIESRLRILGFAVGEEDGTFDERSRAAIKGFQSSRGIPDSGYLNKRTVVRIVRDSNEALAAAQQQQGGQRVVIDGAQVIQGVLEALGGRIDAGETK
ncbi:MAG: peptidoglycan-binding protein [Pseudomonadota bacterium]